MIRYCVGILIAFATAGTALAQAFPTKPVRLIVTYAPGGSSDLMARVFGQKLSEIWGQQVIIESKPGAAGGIGMEFAARQPADGYTFVIGNVQPASVNPLLSKVSYSMDKDFIPVTLISTGPNVLVVNTAWQVKSLDEILSYARANPGKLSYGTSGPGSISHLASEMLKNLAKVNVVDIPYKGSALSIQDLLGQQIQFIFSDALPAMAHIRAGKLRALCTTGAQRFALLPDLPTCDASVPGLVTVNWWGVLLPAGTPKAIVDKLNAAFRQALEDPQVRESLISRGAFPVPGTPADLARHVAVEYPMWVKLVRDSGAKVD